MPLATGEGKYHIIRPGLCLLLCRGNKRGPWLLGGHCASGDGSVYLGCRVGQGKVDSGSLRLPTPWSLSLTCSEGIWKGVPPRNRNMELRGFLAKLCLLLFVYISLVITQVTETPG